MIETKPLANGIFVTAQIRPEDVAALAATFGTIVNNRPDGEELGQPRSDEIEAAARRNGLGYAFIPLTHGEFTAQEIMAFADVVADAARPILAFCRSGSRSTRLWALSQAGVLSIDELLTAASAAGYDLNAFKPRLEEEVASK